MNPACIPHTRAPKATALYLDYLYHFGRVQDLYSGSPLNLASYQGVAREISGQYPRRDALVEILLRQNQALGCGEATLANLRRLRDPNVLAVVTGQQVGLFSGPAFTLYKALTAVRLAQSLSEQGLPCVPLFWLATEDHDLEEVAKTAVLNADGELVPLRVAGEQAVAGCSVGYVKLPLEVSAVLDQLEEVLPSGKPRDRLLQDLRESYAPGAAWGESFARFMARLFSRFGVILMDPLNAPVHELARGAYEQALLQAPRLRALLQERSRKLVDSGYHAQVHVADDSTLLFAASEGARIAIHQQAEGFKLPGLGPVSLERLQGWMAKSPLDFTPSALLRPVIQDSILPTIAYVAGPAEVAYFAQAQALYLEFGRPMPVLFPRAGFTLIDRRFPKLFEKYHLALEDVWQGEEHLRRKIAAAGADENGTQAWSQRIDRGERDIQQAFDGLRGDVEGIDPTLLDAIRTAQDKMMFQMDKLKGKISRAALERSELLTRHEQELLHFLTPAGNLQEREVSGIYFLARAGYELLDRLLIQVQMHCLDHQLFVY